MLITRPEHDKVTTYLSTWSEELILLAAEKGIQYKDLCAENATKEEVEKYLRKQNPKLIILNGHGSPDAISGHKNEPIITRGQNEDILAEKIIYARACHSAAELGPAAIAKGAVAFIG